MRTLSFSAVTAFLFFSSFTPAGKNAVIPAGDVYHIDETSVEGVYFSLCNGDFIYVPELTTHMNIKQVRNGNMLMADGIVTQTGKGYSMNTGEEYTINLEDNYHNKESFINNAEVYNQKSEGTITGANGSKDNYMVDAHLRISAKGEVISSEYEYTPECH